MRQRMKKTLSLALGLLTLSALVLVYAADSMHDLFLFAGICTVDVLFYLYERREPTQAHVISNTDQGDGCEWPSARDTLDSLSLTAREKEVAMLLLSGDSQKMIAAKLEISTSTVSFHTRNLYRKLAIQSKGQLFSALFATKTLGAA